MRNVPPQTANYIQRAGRAGRRTDTAAFALTFAQRRSHDLTYYADPERMVSGKIRPPYFEILNEKIVRRHVHSVVFAAFFRNYREMFGNVDSFFKFGTSLSETGLHKFKVFLESQPPEILETLMRIIPTYLQTPLGIMSWDWINGLFDENDGILAKAAEELYSDIESLESVRRTLFDENRPLDHIRRAMNTIKERYLLDFLAMRNILPKYGFPVDVVELQILHHGEEAKKLELERDLRIAISEYAPESSIVAAGRMWTSYGLKKVPNRSWPRYQYSVCKYCGRYQRVRAETEQRLHICVGCGSQLEHAGFFVVPEFGFITSDREPRHPGESRSERTYTSRVFFADEGRRDEEMIRFSSGRYTFVGTYSRDGTLAVINRAGFKVCYQCGFGIRSGSKVSSTHQSPWGRPCRGTLSYCDLGHEFKTDIFNLRLEGCSNPNRSFWLSLLYALLEGASEALDVRREDLDGCLYPYSGNPSQPAIILFDDVPGGAGHVKRICNGLEAILKSAFDRMDGKCGCDLSCYGCLRNYRNQFYHDLLNRKEVHSFLKNLLA